MPKMTLQSIEFISTVLRFDVRHKLFGRQQWQLRILQRVQHVRGVPRRQFDESRVSGWILLERNDLRQLNHDILQPKLVSAT